MRVEIVGHVLDVLGNDRVTLRVDIYRDIVAEPERVKYFFTSKRSIIIVLSLLQTT